MMNCYLVHDFALYWSPCLLNISKSALRFVLFLMLTVVMLRDERVAVVTPQLHSALAMTSAGHHPIPEKIWAKLIKITLRFTELLLPSNIL
jgi:hypothetical protein